MQIDVDTDRRPFVLIWELTQACELSCEHCRADAQPDRHPEELTTEQGKELLAEASEFGEGQLVVLSGGDPLIRPDVTELVSYGTRQGLKMTMTPSGTTSLTKDRIEALSEAGLRRMAVSLDGASAATHDAFRGEAGSFEATIEAAEDARDVGLPLQINTTVCASTVSELPNIADRVADLGAVLWSVFFLVPIGRGRVLDPISPDRAERVMEWLAEKQSEAPYGIKTTEAPHYRRVLIERRRESAGKASGGQSSRDPASESSGGSESESNEDPASESSGDSASESGGDSTGPTDTIGRRGGITAGDGFAFVSHTGDLFPSGFLPQSAGNVTEESVVELYRNAELFESLRDKDSLEGKCGACEYRHVCGGSRSRAFAYTGDPLASDPLCAYVPAGYDGERPEQRLAGD